MCKTAIDFQNINLDDKKSLWEPKDLVIGFACEHIIKELIDKDLVNITQVKKFKEDGLRFVLGLLKKIFEKSSLNSEIVRGASIFDPKIIAVLKKSRAENLLKVLLTSLIECRILFANDCDRIMEQFVDFLETQFKMKKYEFVNFSHEIDRLDHFFFHKMNIENYKELAFVVKLVLTLSHGQASIERNFSVGKNCEITNMEPESIIGRKCVKDHMLSNNLKPHNMKIDDQFILDLKAAHSTYEQFLDKKKKQKNSNPESMLKKKLRKPERNSWYRQRLIWLFSMRV